MACFFFLFRVFYVTWYKFYADIKKACLPHKQAIAIATLSPSHKDNALRAAGYDTNMKEKREGGDEGEGRYKGEAGGDKGGDEGEGRCYGGTTNTKRK